MADGTKMAQTWFESWNEYAQAYTDLLVDSTRRATEYSLALRERLDAVVLDSVKKAQALSAREQEAALEVAEAFQAQAQTAGERVAKIFGGGQ